ncbi:MAG: hypothetical protein Q8N44_06205 [Rubrivivax sp.]|nr:hypothetical protein [Rubrivivax sp.]MDP3083268.1 hypothetical protein [Rubrivivax sp.]
MNINRSVDLPSFEVRFASLFRQGFGFAFPCDSQGHVDLDSLSERARSNYFYARAMVGRENAVPVVRPLAPVSANAHH